MHYRFRALLFIFLSTLGLSTIIGQMLASAETTGPAEQPMVYAAFPLECTTSTPVFIVTPNFTPAPGCADTPPDGVLSAVITDHPTTTSALFTNHSTTCSYRIGLA